MIRSVISLVMVTVLPPFFSALYNEFESIEQLACIPAGDPEDRFRFGDRDGDPELVLQPFFPLVKQFDELLFVQNLQNIDLAAGEQGRDHFERRIFGCSADEGHHALFHGAQQGVLLRFAEAVDFVDEQERAVRLPPWPGI